MVSRLCFDYRLGRVTDDAALQSMNMHITGVYRICKIEG